MKRLFALVIIVALAASMLVVIPVHATQAALPDYQPVDWQSGLAGEVAMPRMGPVTDGGSSTAPSVAPGADPPSVGTTVWDWYLDDLSYSVYGVEYPYMTLRAISGNVEVWVAQDEMLQFPSGDIRNANPLDWQVTVAMCEYIANEFNNLIYPKDTQTFGAPFDRDGTNTIFEYYGFPAYAYDWIATDNPQRVIIKIFNIVDDNFFDPTYPSYVAGFFDPTLTPYYYNRNMIHVDNWNYSGRLGPLGYSWYTGRTVTRPYVYESTVAHEFQHNIHNDQNPGDETFMNEGCSMYAELLCGYGIETSYFNYYFYTPDNSLTVWGDLGGYDILADYGQVALWTTYLSDHYGGAAFVKYFVTSGIGGIYGINAALKHFGYKVTFDDVYHDWRLANLIRADFPGCDKYNYKSINLNDPAVIPIRQYEVAGLPVPPTTGTSFGNTFAINGYDTGVSRLGAYGSDYIKFTDWTQLGYVYFDGDDTAAVPPGWTMTANGWWSGDGVDLQDTSIAGSAKVKSSDPTLTIVTKYGIESFWDFGLVQVSKDNGKTWTSLSNAYTTSDHDFNARYYIVANLPGLTGHNPGFPDWTTMTFDLSAYKGKDVIIRFRYMTDWGYEAEGWWIKSATVSGKPLTLSLVPAKASYQVALVQAVVVNGKTSYLPYDMSLTDTSQKGIGVAFAKNPGYAILVVSPTISLGDTDYTFQVKKTPQFNLFP
jgi:hypothetical protein